MIIIHYPFTLSFAILLAIHCKNVPLSISFDILLLMKKTHINFSTSVIVTFQQAISLIVVGLRNDACSSWIHDCRWSPWR